MNKGQLHGPKIPTLLSYILANRQLISPKDNHYQPTEQRKIHKLIKYGNIESVKLEACKLNFT